VIGLGLPNQRKKERRGGGGRKTEKEGGMGLGKGGTGAWVQRRVGFHTNPVRST